MRYLRQNTAVRITVGPFLDHADGLTPLDAFTEATLIGVIAYDADDNDAVTAIHFHPAHHDAATDNDMVALGYAGMWDVELTAGNTNYTGRMMLALTDATQICPVFHEFQVLAANVYDSLFAGHGLTADLLDVAAIAALTTTVASASSTTVFVLTAGSAIASAYSGMLIALTDATDAHTEVRRIVSYAVTTKTVTVDRAFGFTPASPDIAVIMATGYADVNTTHVAGTAQTANDNAADINDILTDTGELQTLWTTGGALDLLLKDAPSTSEFNARTLAAADYFIVSDYVAIGSPMQAGNVTVGGYASNQGPLYLLTGGTYVLVVDANGKVAVPDTQKVDVNTIKTKAVTCADAVTVLASVGTAATSIAQGADSNIILAKLGGMIEVES